MANAPAEILSAIADRAEEIMQSQRQESQTGLLRLPTRVEGRVFCRLHQFARLPAAIKAQADAVALYLSSPDVLDRVFSRRHWLLPPPGRARGSPIGAVVQGQALVDAILRFLVRTQASNATEHTAKQLAEVLVLSGFISPVKEPTSEPLEVDASPEAFQATVGRYIKAKEYYELVSTGVLHALESQEQREAELLEGTARATKLSVWDVVDGATRAGRVFRKQPPSLLRSLVASLSFCHASPQSHEKQNYVVVNRVRHRSVFVFPDDVARHESARISLVDAMVQYEPGTRNAPMFHGLKLWTDEHTERLDFMSRHEQDEWLLSLLDGGARYKESHRRFDKLIAASFYAMHDVNASGNEFAMGDIVRGKVVLLVNTASKDPEAALHMPELVTLREKYHDDGLRIIACPSDQFLGLEFATEQQIVTHAQHTYGARFRILAKRNVNGPNAREPFLYCNAHLPGAFGPFTEWNFTKFLIDRRGKPFRRFETRVLPLEMEGEIRRLLGLGQLHEPPSVVDEVAEELHPEKVVAEIREETSCSRPGCS